MFREKKKFTEAEGHNRIFNAGFAISNKLNHSGYEYLSMKYFAKLVFNWKKVTYLQSRIGF